jgi:hypothetical protein
MDRIQQLVIKTLNKSNNVYYLNLDITFSEIESAVKFLSLKSDDTCVYVRSDYIAQYKLVVTRRDDEYYGIIITDDNIVESVHIIDITKLLNKIIFDSIDNFLIDPIPYHNYGLTINTYEEFQAHIKLFNDQYVFVKSQKDMKLYIAMKDNVYYSIAIKNNYYVHNINVLNNYQNLINNMLDRHHN